VCAQRPRQEEGENEMYIGKVQLLGAGGGENGRTGRVDVQDLFRVVQEEKSETVPGDAERIDSVLWRMFI